MQKILVVLLLLTCAGADQDADAKGSLAALLRSRNPTEAFNPSVPAAPFAMRKHPLASSRSIDMRAKSPESEFQPMDLSPSMVQTAGLLAAMTPLLAHGEIFNESEDSIAFGGDVLLKLYVYPWAIWLAAIQIATMIRRAIDGEPIWQGFGYDDSNDAYNPKNR